MALKSKREMKRMRRERSIQNVRYAIHERGRVMTKKQMRDHKSRTGNDRGVFRGYQT